ncbi:EcoAI/FtnUII family type I restriction enzme subunit R [Bartonella sp. HY761]|uniref:EcoAI/FtnUII family type I restriction enzme subunit R n=1 Tax=Bartonella sp. HY761 TaxID=2979330 RepID=UPI002202379D|nr:type I restriction endonuclease subunit R [Bartonella sp. HY761]UXN06769.1 DEAD/DEAH box helicase family protein [Bartonella sp. HY761]
MAYNETEADTCSKRINPALTSAGWGVVEHSNFHQEFICPGRILSGSSRGKPLRCDYVLTYKDQKLAVLEAKKVSISHREGVAQAKDYATRLGTRFAYASNGVNWYEIDMETGKEQDIALPFPSPDELWARAFSDVNIWRELFGAVEFETAGGRWFPRYYQHRAITAVLEAIANNKKRILLTLATGTGKTSIAFQIAWKLFKSKWNLSGTPTREPRILFLADRNFLANQAINSFSAFSADAITRIDPKSLDKFNGKVPKNASLFFTIFQTFMTGEIQPVYQQYDPDFFDFIIIDECHRGGANDQSEWRAILEYFSPAVQLGLTATPKRNNNGDTYAYFGEPVYSYALKQGIEDGYLTPFKVRQMASTIDDYVFDGTDEILEGEVKIGTKFEESDFNRDIVIRERELSRVREFMSEIDQRQKTIVFCARQDHAALVRDLINQIKTNPNPYYCCRVTADDGAIGEQHMVHFQDNEKTIPTILTTSQKLSTGLDALNVRNIVLMRPVKNIIEFKQIIGRGTRVFEGKGYFTIWDFVKAYENFNDPEWDGEPLAPEPTTPKPDGTVFDPVNDTPDSPPTEDENKKQIEIKLSDGKERSIQYIATTSYFSRDGKIISAQEFMQQIFGDLTELLPEEDDLRKLWSDPSSREKFLQQLDDIGYHHEQLEEIRRLVDARDSDLYDVLAYIRFNSVRLTRAQRANATAAEGMKEFEGEMRNLVTAILRSYVSHGESELAQTKLKDFLSARYGTINEAKTKLGGLDKISSAYITLQKQLYSH